MSRYDEWQKVDFNINDIDLEVKFSISKSCLVIDIDTVNILGDDQNIYDLLSESTLQEINEQITKWYLNFFE